MEGAALANGEVAPHGEANESKDGEEAPANQQRDEELAVANGDALLQGSANEGRRSCSSANEDAEPQEVTNDSTEPQPANKETGHKSPTNEDTGHKAAANEDTALPATNENTPAQAPTNQGTAPAATANENNTCHSPPNQDTPPQHPTNDLAALPAAANQAADPWDWTLEEAWLRAPEEEVWAEPEGWGAEPDDDDDDDDDVVIEESPEQWRPSPDGSWAKLIVRPGRGLQRPGLGSWCRVRLSVHCSGQGTSDHCSGQGLSDHCSGQGLSVHCSSQGLSDHGPSVHCSSQGLSDHGPSVHGLSVHCSGQGTSDRGPSAHGLSDHCSGRSPDTASSSGHELTIPSVSTASSSGHELTIPSVSTASSSGHELTIPSVSTASGSGHGLSVPSSDPSVSAVSISVPSPVSLSGRWLSIQLGTALAPWSLLLDAVLETMTLGELSLLRPSSASITLSVRLSRFTPSPPFWAVPSPSRWGSVTSGRAQAVSLLSRGLWLAAGRALSRSLRLAAVAAGVPPLPPATAALKAELHADLALVQLRLGLPAAAAGNAAKALALCPAHLEARYRRGVARAAMSDLEAAREDLVAVLGAQPGHAGARGELRRVRGALRERDARLARRLGRLFA